MEVSRERFYTGTGGQMKEFLRLHNNLLDTSVVCMRKAVPQGLVYSEDRFATCAPNDRVEQWRSWWKLYRTLAKSNTVLIERLRYLLYYDEELCKWRLVEQGSNLFKPKYSMYMLARTQEFQIYSRDETGLSINIPEAEDVYIKFDKHEYVAIGKVTRAGVKTQYFWNQDRKLCKLYYQPSKLTLKMISICRAVQVWR